MRHFMSEAEDFARLIAGILILVLLYGTALADPFDADGVLCLVNRDEKLSKDYEPEEMILPDVPTNKKSQAKSIYMRPDAARALEELFAGAKEDGYTLLAVSGYRSYATQRALFNRKVEEVGSREAAQRTVAPPGASEHQTALAMDVVSDTFRNLNRLFLETEEGIWVNDHCWEYGFIIRYRKEWSDVTGYKAEPWHIRYIGREHAEAVTRLNIPYETYAFTMRELPAYVLEEGSAALYIGLFNDLNSGDYMMAEVLENSDVTEDQRREALEEVTVCYLNASETE